MLAHDYDLHVFMTAGSIVAHGGSPYEFEGRALIPGTSDQAIGSLGYPPLWGLYLAVAYALSFNLIPNFFIYNLAIKLPIIASNIILALLAKRICLNRVWLIFLFHPFVLYFSSAWGQFDGIVGLLTVLSVLLLTRRNVGLSALSLALAVSLKILPIVLLPMVLIYSYKRGLGSEIGRYLVVFLGALSVVNLSPFLILGWSIGPIITGWSFHFTAAGAMTPFNILELIYGTTTLTPGLAPLGFLWIPTVAVIYIALSRTRLNDLEDLVRWGSAIMLGLLLSRAWTSEQNVYMLLPLVALGVGRGLSWRNLHLILAIPLVFTVLNFSLPQMLFLIQPALREFIPRIDAVVRGWRLLARFLVVLVWDAIAVVVIARAVRASRPNQLMALKRASVTFSKGQPIR